MAITPLPGTGNVTTYFSNSGTTCVLDKPSAAAAGDVFVAAVWGRSNTAAYTAPTGWTVAPPPADITGPGIMRFYTRVVSDPTAEPANYTWSGGVAGRVNGILFRATGGDPASLFDVAGAEATATSDGTNGALALPGVSTAAAGELLIALTGAQVATGATRGTFIAPAGWTRIGTSVTNTGSAESDFAVDALVVSASGATGTKTFTRAPFAQSGMGYMIALKALAGLQGLLNGAVSTTVSVVAGQAVTLTASSSGGNGNAVTYGWAWGDGATTAASATATASHTYSTAGTYTVTMTPFQA